MVNKRILTASNKNDSTMTKEMLNKFEDLELFAENVEYALEEARKNSEYPLDLRLHIDFRETEIYDTESSIAHYNEMLVDAVNEMIAHHQCETFIDIYENTPAEAVFTNVTIWLAYDYETKRVRTHVTC